MKKHLVSNFVESVKPPERGQVAYWDAKLAGFGLRVSQGGKKTWTIFYRRAGRMRWMTLGSYPAKSLAEARAEARMALAKAQNGDDPAEAKKAQVSEGVTFGDLAQLYMKRHAMEHKKSWRGDQRMLKHDPLPAWEGRKLSDIKRSDVVLLLDRIVDRGAGTMANRVQALLSKVFNFGIARGVTEENPAAKVARPGKEVQRERVLNEDEIRSVWSVLEGDAELERFAPIFRLGLLMAQREGEIVGMRWDELDLEHGWWTIPGERTKNSVTHRVPLLGEALSILNGLRAGQHDSVFVFRGDRRGRPVSSLYKPMIRVRKLSAIVDFRYHDLRRTVRTGLASLGVDDSVADKDTESQGPRRSGCLQPPQVRQREACGAGAVGPACA
jgi:integrase